MAGYLKKTLAEIGRLSNREFESWWIYHTYIEPIGERREDLRAGSMITPLFDFLQLVAKNFGIKTPGFTTMYDWELRWADMTAQLKKEKKKTKPISGKQSVNDQMWLLKARAQGEEIRRMRKAGIKPPQPPVK